MNKRQFRISGGIEVDREAIASKAALFALWEGVRLSELAIACESSPTVRADSRAAEFTLFRSECDPRLMSVDLRWICSLKRRMAEKSEECTEGTRVGRKEATDSIDSAPTSERNRVSRLLA
jgi:hypothetical protein